MSQPTHTAPTPALTSEDEAVIVACYANRAEAREHSTVLLAKGITHWTADTPGGVEVRVPLELAAAARDQLAAYEAEEEAAAAEPPPLEVPIYTRPPWLGLSVMVLILSVVHFYKSHGHEWVEKAWSRNGQAIFQDGEVWRLFSALLVHADLSHLLGNVTFGGLFMYFVHRAYGPAWAWLAVIIAGGLGNLMVAAMFYPQAFAGIGASTAVFAAVGLLVAHGLMWTRWSRQLRGHRAWLGPLGGGLALLGLFGSGGESSDVDVAAHLFGFIAGGLLGLPLAWRQKRRLSAQALPTLTGR